MSGLINTALNTNGVSLHENISSRGYAEESGGNENLLSEKYGMHKTDLWGVTSLAGTSGLPVL